MTTIEEVENFVRSHGVGLDSHIETDEGELRISIRDGVDDEPSQSVYIEARRVAKAIREKFGDAVKVGSEIVDEWIDVTVYIKK
jgi:hypothetical protein